MAAQLYLITKSSGHATGQTVVDGLVEAIVNSDDGGSDAVKIAEAEASAVAAGFAIESGYFDTVELLGPPTAGIMTTDEDAIFVTPRGLIRSIA